MSNFTFEKHYSNFKKQNKNNENNQQEIEFSLEGFSPKKQTVRNILNYSKSLNVSKSAYLEYFELTLN